MDYIPPPERRFKLKINALSFYKPYLRWLRHLDERLGLENTLSIWNGAFADYDEGFLGQILSSGWYKVRPDEAHSPENRLDDLLAEFFPTAGRLSSAQARDLIEAAPPVAQFKRQFAFDTVEKEIGTYDALHLRFNGLAYLAETLIESHGKQGELIAYDLVVEQRLAAGKGETGSVEEFIEYFTDTSDTPNLFSAGLEIEIVSKSKREAIIHVRECEWARYFQEHHPQVGYLMACSTDEVAYKAFNPSLRLQRTGTLMEGSQMCDFRIYAIDEEPDLGRDQTS